MRRHFPNIKRRRGALSLLWLASGLTVLGLSFGCGHSAVPQAKPAAVAMVAPPPPMAAPAAAVQAPSEGSLWQAGQPLSDLYSNVKARQVGDIVTVKIVETSSAKNSADTQTGRESTLSAGIDSLLGLEKRFNNQTAKHPFFNPYGTIKGGMTNSFTGNGTTSRSGDLTAYLTARVATVLPNGDLYIIGTREITVNRERQFITLAGTIRPRDISPENVVLSTFMADARITYSGSGIINEKQRPGWLARVLDGVWPF